MNLKLVLYILNISYFFLISSHAKIRDDLKKIEPHIKGLEKKYPNYKMTAFGVNNNTNDVYNLLWIYETRLLNITNIKPTIESYLSSAIKYSFISVSPKDKTKKYLYKIEKPYQDFVIGKPKTKGQISGILLKESNIEKLGISKELFEMIDKLDLKKINDAIENAQNKNAESSNNVFSNKTNTQSKSPESSNKKTQVRSVTSSDKKSQDTKDESKNKNTNILGFLTELTDEDKNRGKSFTNSKKSTSSSKDEKEKDKKDTAKKIEEKPVYKREDFYIGGENSHISIPGVDLEKYESQFITGERDEKLDECVSTKFMGLELCSDKFIVGKGSHLLKRQDAINRLKAVMEMVAKHDRSIKRVISILNNIKRVRLYETKDLPGGKGLATYDPPPTHRINFNPAPNSCYSASTLVHEAGHANSFLTFPKVAPERARAITCDYSDNLEEKFVMEGWQKDFDLAVCGSHSEKHSHTLRKECKGVFKAVAPHEYNREELMFKSKPIY